MNCSLAEPLSWRGIPLYIHMAISLTCFSSPFKYNLKVVWFTQLYKLYLVFLISVLIFFKAFITAYYIIYLLKNFTFLFIPTRIKAPYGQIGIFANLT